MYIISTLKSNTEPLELVEPGAGSLDNPAMLSKGLAGVDAASGNPDLHAALAHSPAQYRIIVSLISIQLLRTLPWSASSLFYRLDCIKHYLKHLRIMRVCWRELCCKWNTLSLYHNMALRARFSAIRRIRPSLRSPRGAATQNESTHALLQSIISAWPSLSRSVWWSFLQTPALCQSRKRRQQVTPEPHPISSGSIFQGMPLFKTKMMPVKAALFDTLGRPAFVFLGGSGGNNGSTTDQRSSVTNGLGITHGIRYCRTTDSGSLKLS